MEWKKVADESEQGVISLETVVRGTCTPEHLLDIVENFTVFEEGRGGLVKKVAKNHQYLGVNHAIEAVTDIQNNQGRLGVFWHTQGSGKSLSMVFLTQKILRKLQGNWTFVIVTDRKELDGQIYKTFAATGAVTEAEAHADSTQRAAAAAHRGSPLCLHADPEIPHRERGRHPPCAHASATTSSSSPTRPTAASTTCSP